MRDPRVSVNVLEMHSQLVTVDGQVTEPGMFPVTGDMTLMRAIARARGTTEFARLQDVVVFRTVGDQHMAALYNLEAIRRGLYPDPAVYPNDLVVVGDSPARRMFRDIIQASGLIVTPIVALLQNI
jgi:polysaccharide biosynthesis/export protein